MSILLYVVGQLGFAFDGRTLYVRILAPKTNLRHVKAKTPEAIRAYELARHRAYRARRALAIRSEA